MRIHAIIMEAPVPIGTEMAHHTKIFFIVARFILELSSLTSFTSSSSSLRVWLDCS
jgi:hypothetical protein